MRLPSLLTALGLAAVVIGACTGDTATSPTTTTITQVEPTGEFSADAWQAVNLLLRDLYKFPPVIDTDELNSAAFLVSNTWFELVETTVPKLEGNEIEWVRTSPVCYLFHWYIEADIQMRDASTPIEFLAAEQGLVERVRWLDEAADEMALSKVLGESLVIHPTEEECTQGFVER